MSWVVFSNDHEAAGIFVEAVDDAWALDAADARERALAVVEEGIDESARTVAGAGVNHQVWGFIEHEDVRVLEDDVEGEFFGLGKSRFGRWDFEL